MRRFSLIPIFSACAAIALAAASPQLEELKSGIARDGAQAVITRLFNNRANWEALISHINSAERDWVSLGIALLAGTDAGSISEIHDALFSALGVDPGYLLHQPSSANFDIISICNGRDDPPATYNAAESEQLAVKRKVSALGEEFGDRRRLCLAALDSRLKDIQRFYDVHAR
jgi:hypothetical protein